MYYNAVPQLSTTCTERSVSGHGVAGARNPRHKTVVAPVLAQRAGTSHRGSVVKGGWGGDGLTRAPTVTSLPQTPHRGLQHGGEERCAVA